MVGGQANGRDERQTEAKAHSNRLAEENLMTSKYINLHDIS